MSAPGSAPGRPRAHGRARPERDGLRGPDDPHARELKILGGTILPFGGDTFGFSRPEREAARQAVNAWIRTGGEFDAVADFDAALRDPDRPERLLAAYDSGDHLHPNDAGASALADAVPLEFFRWPQPH